MKYIIYHLWIISLLFPLGMQAKVRLTSIWGDNMVLQQQSEVTFHGKASANSKITIEASWNHRKLTTRSDQHGNWNIQLPTPAAGGPYTITFSDGEALTLNNILLGEVWFCSGQSNMEMPVRGFRGQPVYGSQPYIVAADSKRELRLFTVKRDWSTTPKEEGITGYWSELSPKEVGDFSATAYFFGDLLQRSLDIPVGLIHCSWSASKIETWMDKETLSQFPEIQLPDIEQIKFDWPAGTPTLLWNAMVNPWKGFPVKGVIWYQGEDNWNRAHTYADMFTTLINGWRTEWKQGDFPFYYCQIAPYDYGIITERGKEVINTAYLREAQAQVEHRVPNTGMAVLLDAGMEKGIHPARKQVAGERLALLALTKTYGIEGVNGESPYYKSIEIKNDTVIVSFERAGMWISGKNCFESKNFEVAGEDKVFYPAKAWIERSKMLVKSEMVPHPVAVRYGFVNYVEGDVYCDGLPLGSFRSDDW